MNLSVNLNARDEKLIVYLMILTPFIDLLNGIFEQILAVSISPGVLIRSVILILIMYIYVMQDKENLIRLIFIISLFLFQMLVLSFIENINIYEEVSFIAKIYYNMFLFFIIYDLAKRKKINYEMYINKLALVNIIVVISLVITKILGIGEDAYGAGIGHRGLYTGLNDITAVCIMTFPFLVYKLIKEKNKVKYSIFTIISALSIVNIGTKTSMVTLVILLIFFAYQVVFKEQKVGNRVLFILAIILSIIIFKNLFWDMYNETVITRLQYLSGRLDFKTFLLSGRNNTLTSAFGFWDNYLFNILFGLGFTYGGEYITSFLPGHAMIEMDFYDILYFYGIIVFIIISIPLLKATFKSIYILIRDKDILYKATSLVYLITISISFLGGHILLSPLAGIYFVVIYGMITQIYTERGKI